MARSSPCRSRISDALSVRSRKAVPWEEDCPLRDHVLLSNQRPESWLTFSPDPVDLAFFSSASTAGPSIGTSGIMGTSRAAILPDPDDATRRVSDTCSDGSAFAGAPHRCKHDCDRGIAEKRVGWWWTGQPCLADVRCRGTTTNGSQSRRALVSSAVGLKD